MHPQGHDRHAFVPVLCGSAFKNKGVQPLLDAVVDYLPAPMDIPAIKGDQVRTDIEIAKHATDDEPFAGLAFKIMNDPFVGSLTFVRVYSGIARIRQLYSEHGQGQARTGRPHVADACQFARRYQGSPRRRHRRLRRSQGHHHRRHAVRLDDLVILERMEFPEPVIEVAVEPKTEGRPGKDGRRASARLAAEDPSFRVTTDQESGQTVIKGMGELHLEIIVDRMKREFKVEANVGAPQVAYRETISQDL